MSASLVGSEMCIRDSLAAGWALAPVESAPTARARAEGPPRSAGLRPGRAVSYTHLTLPTICSV
eukprot:12813817-Alexandrium_andersonii.AAC.1